MGPLPNYRTLLTLLTRTLLTPPLSHCRTLAYVGAIPPGGYINLSQPIFAANASAVAEHACATDQ